MIFVYWILLCIVQYPFVVYFVLQLKKINGFSNPKKLDIVDLLVLIPFTIVPFLVIVFSAFSLIFCFLLEKTNLILDKMNKSKSSYLD